MTVAFPWSYPAFLLEHLISESENLPASVDHQPPASLVNHKILLYYPATTPPISIWFVMEFLQSSSENLAITLCPFCSSLIREMAGALLPTTVPDNSQPNFTLIKETSFWVTSGTCSLCQIILGVTAFHAVNVEPNDLERMRSSFLFPQNVHISINRSSQARDEGAVCGLMVSWGYCDDAAEASRKFLSGHGRMGVWADEGDLLVRLIFSLEARPADLRFRSTACSGNVAYQLNYTAIVRRFGRNVSAYQRLAARVYRTCWMQPNVFRHHETSR